MTTPAVYRFGPFRLDQAACRLVRDEVPVEVSPRLVDLLRLLVSRPGDLLTKEELMEALWPGVFVTENALTHAVSDLRQALGDHPSNPVYIQTVARRGYRFVAPVDVRVRQEAAAAAETPVQTLEGYRAWMQGRLQLETLTLSALPSAVASFEQAAALAPRDPLAHVGLANARLMQFEATRAADRPEPGLRDEALREVREALALDTANAEGWATLAFGLVSSGQFQDAAAAARRAVALEPGNWRHQFRLAYASWGEERLRAVDRTLALLPDFAFAYFLASMVHVARRAMPSAEAALSRGTLLQDQQVARPVKFPAVGLHWIAGLVSLARPGGAREAIAHFERETEGESGGQIFGAEFVVNAWHAKGCAHLRLDDPDAAAAAFRESLARQPRHARSRLGLSVALGRTGREAEAAEAAAGVDGALQALVEAGRLPEAALVSAIAATLQGRADQANAILERLLTDAPPGYAGWTIPVEPLLTPLHGSPGFDRVLAMLAERAA
jgi:DNA-binding winged helix-turn-helix (wHTH) protein